MNAGMIAAGLSATQIHILRHSLGVPDPGQTKFYRNHFVTGEGSIDFGDCISLTSAGLMTHHPGSPITGGDDAFLVTDAGRAVVRIILEAGP